MNRSDLMHQFGASVDQASTDLNHAIGFALDKPIYDRSARTYVRGPGFKQPFLEPDPSRYLTQLRAVTDSILDRENSRIADLPPCATSDAGAGLQPRDAAAVVRAIRRTNAIVVEYPSPSSPESCWRWIAPQAIAFDGFHWCTKAFCLTDDCFKDFLLSLMLEILDSRERKVPTNEDRDWNTEVTMGVGLHPKLSERQAKVIAVDYGVCDGEVEIKVRRALLYYALRRLVLDTDAGAREAQDQQIALLNSVERIHEDHG